MMKMVDGVEVEMTPEEVAEWELQQAATARYVPQSVAMWQAREILIDEGLLDNVYAFFETIGDPIEKAKAIAKFEYSSTVQRNDPLVMYVIPLMGKSEADIDDMFIRAEAL